MFHPNYSCSLEPDGAGLLLPKRGHERGDGLSQRGTVAVIELEFALKEEFGIAIPGADAEKITAVGDAVTYIKSMVR